MAMFQRDAGKSMAADIAAKVAERDNLVGRLAAAEDAVVAATSAATDLAMSGGTDDVLDKAERKTLAARERQTTLKSALAQLGAKIVALENAYAEHQDKTTRRQTARECEKMADDLEEVGRDLDEPLARMVAITSRASSAQIWDAVGLNTFSESSRAQIPAAIAALAIALREHGLRTMDGREARATLLQAPAPAATVKVIEPPVERVLTLQNIKWTADDGRLMTASKFCDCDLPIETAKRAIASRACAPTDSDVRRTWAGTRPMTHPEPDQCVSVDGADIVKIDAPIDARFERLDRGKPFEVSVSRKA